MNALKEELNISEKDLQTLRDNKTKSHTLNFEAFTLQFQFTQKRKANTDSYAKISFLPKTPDSSKEAVEKDLFFGLFILGTEKHESRRIDNQLRGRAGRQGDPGVSVFFVALDDSLMRKMGGEKIQALAGMLLSKTDLESLELTQKQFSKAIIRSQKEIEGRYFGIRKHLFDYDSVVDKQRKRVYRTRDEILESEHDENKQESYVAAMKEEFLTEAKNILMAQITNAEITGQSVADLLVVLNKEHGLNITQPEYHELSKLDYEALKAMLLERLDAYFSKIFSSLETKVLFQIFREVHLHFIDKLWVDHIDEMQNLREKVGLMSYAQLDPLVIYKKESFEKFQELLANITNHTASYLMKLDFELIAHQQGAQLIEEDSDESKVIEILSSASKDLPPQARKTQNERPDARATIFESDDVEVFEAEESPVQKVIKPEGKVRPNDPCPCGSGKKYKKCCGKE